MDNSYATRNIIQSLDNAITFCSYLDDSELELKLKTMIIKLEKRIKTMCEKKEIIPVIDIPTETVDARFKINNENVIITSKDEYSFKPPILDVKARDTTSINIIDKDSKELEIALENTDDFDSIFFNTVYTRNTSTDTYPTRIKITPSKTGFDVLFDVILTKDNIKMIIEFNVTNR